LTGVTDSPRISFAMPVLNGESWLARALHSILAQDETELEVVVFDNSSTDSTRAIAEEFASRDPRVIVRSGERVSAALSFKRALRATRSGVVCWAAYDDSWDPRFATLACNSIDSGHDFFIPNWWVGNIASGRGRWAQKHPLTSVQVASPTARLFSFINLHHSSHKCNAVYAVYRREFLLDCLSMQDISDDGAFCANVIYRGSGVLDDQVLFYKNFFGHNTAFRFKAALNALSAGRLGPVFSSGFDEAKARALIRLKALWPYWAALFDEIYANYDHFGSGPIIAPSHLAKLVDAAEKVSP